MSLPLLQTKLYVPSHQRQKNVVPRPHLTEKLNAGLVGKVTLISAPAGFGKSTLLSEWSAALQVKLEADPATIPAISNHVTWLTLDSDDNDPVRFLLYLIASLQKFDSTVGETTWGLLQSPQPPAPKTILTILLNDLSRLAGEESQPYYRYVLVLEDYHEINAQPIHEILTYLIDHVPPHVHVIITTRADPPLPFPRWRVRDQLSEIRAADLRFTPDEAATFLNDRMRLHLAADEVMALEIRTEGWIAGLQLVALSLQRRANKADFLRTFSGSHRYVLNYLVEEVLDQQPKALQEFLLRTSMLERLCGPLCDAVIGDWGLGINPVIPTTESPISNPQSQTILEQLEQANLFLAPLDDEGQWYRYHPLFAEVLQHRLHQTQPAALPHLHGRASVWYERQGLLAEAIHHALRAADFARTAELIEQSWPTTWNQGAVATLLNWVQALPPEVLVNRPNLAISYAWALALAGQIEVAEAGLRQVEAMLQGSEPELEPAPIARDTRLGRIAALRAMLAARRGEPVHAVQLAQTALSLIPVDRTLLRGNACYALGLAYQQNGALPEALRAYQEATRLGVAADDHFLTIAAHYHEGRIWMAQGQLRIAANTYQQLLTAAAQHERPMPVIGLVHVGYAEILYQWNDLVAAAHQVESGLALSPSGSLTYTDGPFHRFLTLTRIRQAMGDQEGTLVAVQLATDTARQTGIALDAGRAAALAALIQLRLGRPEVAGQWAQGYAQSLLEEETFTYVHEFETLIFVRILLAQARAAEVLALLARWLPAAEAAQRMGSVIELCMLQAQALRLGGQSVAATQTLVRALALAEPEGYLRLFVDEGEPMRLLMVDFRAWIVTQADTQEQTQLLTYVDKLLQAFEQPQPAEDEWQAAGQPAIVRLPVDSAQGGELVEAHAEVQTPKLVLEGSKPQNLIEPLTVRELEVLRLMAAGLSNAEIAKQLVVTVGTVKSHLKHIYGKLAVQSRTQAVAQARALGLL
jgi:LuxR family maltose regulon positive regulatory protein